NKMGLPTATEFLDMITGQYIADLISWGAIGARTTESQIHREMASALSSPVGFKNGTNKMGLPTATEFLDMITGQYIADLISWGAIGARTTESQIHREMASALSSPVGFKNGTDGNITIAVDAIRASRESHLFCSPDKHGAMTIYRTAGNPDGHVILRGGHQPNYHAHDVQAAANTLAGFGLPTKLVVDFSHGNCQKQHRRQLEVCADIAAQIHGGEQAIAGIMAESFLQEGNQAMGSADSRTYGQSITDPCLGWEDTEKVLAQLANAVMARKNT
ncbi:3-deoxy-7-phosphoheptulonate synthase, partial [Salinivibrio sp. MA427]|uniref:3-deoxy-7-phosphoheptulonate synthase n=1 Tax=Salinivibrio sp. MA427 TaxID=1909455 RepID=UPI000D52EE91